MSFSSSVGSKIKRLMISFVLVLLLVYVVLCAGVYFFADRLIFQPQQGNFYDDASVIKLTTPNGQTISAKHFPNKGADFTILFSHGNAEDIFTSSPFFLELSEAGFNVLAYDYRGYGTSEGIPSEANAYEDIETAYNYLINDQRVAPERIIIHGRSLGGAVSVDLASRKPSGGLIVESSFVSAFRVVSSVPFFPFDKFRSVDKIADVQVPILFIHGGEDSLIIPRHSERLRQAARSQTSIYWVKDAGHNDLVSTAGHEYFQRIRSFSTDLIPTR